MVAAFPYTTILAPIAVAQIEAALRWWSHNRPAAPGLLARELEAVLRVIAHVPQVGRRTRSAQFRRVRRLLLRGSGYYIYYQVDDILRVIRIVYFRSARRRSTDR